MSDTPSTSNENVGAAHVSVVRDLPRPATLDQLRWRKKPTTRKVTIVLDPDLADEYNEAKNVVELTRIRYEAAPGNQELANKYADAQDRLADVDKRLSEEIAEFRFRSIGPRAYDALVQEHRATEDQQRRHRKQNPAASPLKWNPDTFPPALVAACCWEPAMSVDEVQALWDDPRWNDGELMELFLAAVEVNQQRRVVNRD